MSASVPTVPRFVRSATFVIVAGCLISAVNFGPRSTMGFYLTPMTSEFGWSRETFAFAIAVQNIVWGLSQPFAGMIADRYGTGRVLAGSALLYIAGLVGMAYSSQPIGLQLSAGFLIGIGVAGSSFSMVLAAFSRLLPARLQPVAYGLGAAAGSFGQFFFAPFGQALIQSFDWHTALLTMAGIMLLVPLLAATLNGRPDPTPIDGQADQTVMQALREAFSHGSYRLLVAGFFVCGFQLGFVTTHLPPYLNDVGIAAKWGGYAIAAIGAFNVIGSFTSGVLSARLPKRLILSGLYFARAVIISVFVLTPPSVVSLMAFAVTLGLTWLSTVPPTQSLVGVMFGYRYLATIYGFVFLSHQLGSFIAVWLGGWLYDVTGSYLVVWWLAAALGVFAGLVHLPIRERPVARLAAAE